jgi:hypothetical protein
MLFRLMTAWRVWWLFGIPVGLLATALTAIGEVARDGGMSSLGDATDVVKVLVYGAWLIAAWRLGARFTVLLGIVLVSLTACTPMEWTRPDATRDQVRTDASDCQQRAWREAQWRSYASGPRGWRYPYWGDRYYDENRLTRFCMEVRGYTLKAAEKN